MANSTAVKQSVVDEGSPNIHGVDPFSGAFCTFIPIAELVGNNGLGPTLDLKVYHTSGRGTHYLENCSIRFNHAYFYEDLLPKNLSNNFGKIYLENGASWTWDGKSDIALPHVVISRDGEQLKFTHKSGQQERLTKFRAPSSNPLILIYEGYYLPTTISSPSGHKIYLQWDLIKETNSLKNRWLPRLQSVSDESGTLLTVDYTMLGSIMQVTFDVWPGTNDNYTMDFQFTKGLLSTVRQSNQIDTTAFEYTGSISKIKHSSGLTEAISYQNGKVSNHLITDNNATIIQNTQYIYTTSKGNQITSVTEIGNKKTEYQFSTNRLPTKETTWVDGLLLKTVELSRTLKNGGTVLTGAANDPLPDRMESTTSTTYTNPDLTARTEVVVITMDTLGNIISKTENGVTTEWTYYRGMLEEDILVKTERVNTPTTPLSVIAGIGDYANPIGWGYLLFGKAGLTWGTRELRQKVISPYVTSNGQQTFNLPVAIRCPGDPNYFKVHVESEKVYTLNNGQRTDLQWTFYSYDGLPVKDALVKGPTLKPSKKLTIYNPVGDANGRLSSWANGNMVLEENTYDTDINSPHHGRLLNSTQSILDAAGKVVPGSVVSTAIGYGLSNNQLTTTTYVTAGTAPAVTGTQVIQTLTGLLQAHIDAQDNTTLYEYDAQRRIIQQTVYAGEPELKGTTTFTYVDAGTETQVTRTSPFGEQSRDVFDTLGRPIRNEWLHTDGSWLKLYEITYDAQGREASTTQFDYTANKTQLPPQTRNFSYDRWGQLSEIKWAASGETENFSYDPVNRKTSTWVAQGSETGGRTIQVFDEPGGEQRHESYLHANGKFVSSQTYRYNALGRLTTEASSEAYAIHRNYDAFGRVSRMETAGITTINDFPAHIQAPVATAAKLESSGQTVSLGTQTVDGLSRVTATVLGGTKVNYAYIGSGNWGKADTQPSATNTSSTRIQLSNAWDAQTRTLTETITGGINRGSDSTTSQARYEYSIQGLLLRSTDAFGNSTQYTYDTQGRLLNSASATLTVDFIYGPLGRLESETLNDLTHGKTMTTAYTYNASGQEIQRQFNATGFPPLTLKTTYTTSLIAEMEILQDASLLRKEEYRYDFRGQLETYLCSGPHKPSTPDRYVIDRQDFIYDMAGNLIQCTVTSNGSTFIDKYTFGAADPCQPQSTTLQRGTTQQTHSYKYDSLGYLINKDGFPLTYNIQGQLTVHRDAQQLFDYHYDNIGRLAGCSGTGHYDQYYYKDDFQYARKGVFSSNGVFSYRTSILMNQSTSCLLLQQSINQDSNMPTTSRSFEVKDIKGSVIASYDLSTNSISYFVYTPYGYRPHTIDQRSWVGFNGHPMDSVTGNYPLGNGARVYNPAKQSFDAPDPISPFGAGGSNRYRYCSNDPVNKSDPSGFAEVLNQYSVITHAPAIENPVVAAVGIGVVGIALAPFTGGASIGWTVAAVGLATVSAGFGIASAALRESDPDLSEALGWAALGTGLLEAGAGAGLALRAARAGAKGAARETSLAYQHSSIAKGQMGVETLTVKTRSLGFHNGPASYELYSGGPNATKAYIYSHGASRAEKFRFALPSGVDLHFFAPKGASIATDDSRLIQHLSGRLNGNYISKAHNSLNPKLAPDYILTEFKPKDMVTNDILKTPQDLDKVMKQLAAAHSIDIIRPKGQIPLSELITSLQAQNYKKIYGSFCRGPIRDFVGVAEIKRIRHSKWRMFVLDMDASLANRV